MADYLVAKAVHTHSTSDISGLQTALDGKANASHTHSISNVTNLQTTLDGKASTTSVSDLQAALEALEARVAALESGAGA